GFSPTTFQYTNTVTGLPKSTTGGTASTFTPAPFGWVGSPQKLADFQQALTNFTKTNPSGQNVNGFGQYFGGDGYPSYVVIAPGHLKLPGGQNLFLASPVVPGGLADIAYIKTFVHDIAPGGATEVGNTVTITTTAPHGLVVGQVITISGFTGPDAGYNG